MRLENWPLLLSDYLAEKRHTPFEWGVNDCVMFAAKGLERLTGQNMYAMYEGYKTEAEAQEIIDNAGGMEALISRHLGPGSRDVLKASRGDLVMMKLPQKTIGMVDDSGQNVACVGPNGMVRLPLKRAWRVWGY